MATKDEYAPALFNNVYAPYVGTLKKTLTMRNSVTGGIVTTLWRQGSAKAYINAGRSATFSPVWSLAPHEGPFSVYTDVPRIYGDVLSVSSLEYQLLEDHKPTDGTTRNNRAWLMKQPIPDDEKLEMPDFVRRYWGPMCAAQLELVPKQSDHYVGTPANPDNTRGKKLCLRTLDALVDAGRTCNGLVVVRLPDTAGKIDLNLDAIAKNRVPGAPVGICAVTLKEEPNLLFATLGVKGAYDKFKLVSTETHDKSESVCLLLGGGALDNGAKDVTLSIEWTNPETHLIISYGYSPAMSHDATRDAWVALLAALVYELPPFKPLVEGKTARSRYADVRDAAFKNQLGLLIREEVKRLGGTFVAAAQPKKMPKRPASTDLPKGAPGLKKPKNNSTVTPKKTAPVAVATPPVKAASATAPLPPAPALDTYDALLDILEVAPNHRLRTHPDQVLRLQTIRAPTLIMHVRIAQLWQWWRTILQWGATEDDRVAKLLLNGTLWTTFFMTQWQGLMGRSAVLVRETVSQARMAALDAPYERVFRSVLDAYFGSPDMWVSPPTPAPKPMSPLVTSPFDPPRPETPVTSPPRTPLGEEPDYVPPARPNVMHIGNLVDDMFVVEEPEPQPTQWSAEQDDDALFNALFAPPPAQGAWTAEESAPYVDMIFEDYLV